MEHLYIANWKMKFTFNEAVEFATTHYKQLIQLGENKNTIALAPSFEALYPLVEIFKETPVKICAQNCSRHLGGSFTGQVAPESLHQVGCSYCIIGHNEHRTELQEDIQAIAQKCIHLLDNDITPVMCIGENRESYEQKRTLEALSEQLEPLLHMIRERTVVHSYLTPYIAYEPSWSIGTGQVAPMDHLEMVFSWLTEQVHALNHDIPWKLLYGGSVTPENVGDLKKIDKIRGFLIGKASLNFQTFEKIVQ